MLGYSHTAAEAQIETDRAVAANDVVEGLAFGEAVVR